jgi:glycosyltransferase involved in cell wall biosynthesis
MGKDILIIAHFCSDFDGNGNNRFNYLADLFSNNGYDVELITTDFSHTMKNRRIKNELILPYKVTMLHEPGYKKNISLQRAYSHFILGINLEKYLKKRKKPDVIYCAVPSLDVARKAAKHAKKHNIRFMIDIQDLWPEAFEMVFHFPVISKLIFCPMRLQANYIYRQADEIIAVSQTYVDTALRVNNKCKTGYSIFLGTELDYFDRLVKKYKVIGKPKTDIWVAYIGTLGHSYDLTCVIDAFKIIKNKGAKNVKFIVMGDGPLKTKFEDYSKELGVNIEFTGRLDYGKMVGLLVNCDIAVNPISHGAAQSIINKHADYAAAGLPVINTQESFEYRDLVNQYTMGLNCENNNAMKLAEDILYLSKEEQIRNVMGQNSRRLAEDKFDRKKSYKKILELLEDII